MALLTSYSYLKLTRRFPGEGGTVEFPNRAFGDGIVTGAANILLLLSYVVLVAVYAYAFGSYGAGNHETQRCNHSGNDTVSHVRLTAKCPRYQRPTDRGEHEATLASDILGIPALMSLTNRLSPSTRRG